MTSVSTVGQSSQASMVSQLRQKAVQESGRAARQEPTPEMRAKFEAKLESAAKDMGIDAEQFKQVRTQIQAKVQELRDSGQRPTREQMDAVVGDVLKQNGIDAEEFKATMQSLSDKMGGPPRGNGHFGGGDGDGDDVAGMMDSMPAGSLVDATA